SMTRRNELPRVLELTREFERAQTSRKRFARRHGLHPSALSRLLRVAGLPAPFLEELKALPRRSRTHLEVLATAPEERRAELLAAVRAGSSTYRLRERRESTAVVLAPVLAPVLTPVGGDV